MSTRWIVTGSGGQLGSCLRARLCTRASDTLVALSRAELDLSDPSAIAPCFESLPKVEATRTVVLNAAAHTAVDRAEQEEELAGVVNGDAPARLAEECHARGFRFVHVSTDYVFDGSATAPYAADAPTAPVTAYGRTKLAGERRVLAADPDALIVRTSWVFGPGRNFVLAILNQGRLRRTGEKEGPLAVVDDQRGLPTYADHLAAGLIALAELPDAAEVRGFFHLSNAPEAGDVDGITWWDFARAILDRSGYADLEIDRTKTADDARPAQRPAYSVLDTSRAASLGVSLPSWSEGLDAYLATLGPEDGMAQ